MSNSHIRAKISDLIPSHSYGTRFSVMSNINSPHITTSRTSKSFFVRSIHYWNSIPTSIRASANSYVFKNNLKKYLLEN